MHAPFISHPACSCCYCVTIVAHEASSQLLCHHQLALPHHYTAAPLQQARQALASVLSELQELQAQAPQQAKQQSRLARRQAARLAGVRKWHYNRERALQQRSAARVAALKESDYEVGWAARCGVPVHLACLAVPCCLPRVTGTAWAHSGSAARS
jgi:hypothetical protein